MMTMMLNIPTVRRALLLSAAMAMTLQMVGCGDGGESSQVVIAVVPSAPAVQLDETKNSYKIIDDSYGMQAATYLTATRSLNAIVLRTAIAASMTDPEFQTVFRIDIASPEIISEGSVYALGGTATSVPAFPGTLYFFNGHQSTLLKTVSGTIRFTACGAKAGDKISGTFSAVIEDGNSRTTPKASYTITSEFAFIVGTYGAILPVATPVPMTAADSYDANCAACHALGNYDRTVNGIVDLSLKGGELNSMFTPDLPGHSGVKLSAVELNDLKILLNAN